MKIYRIINTKQLSAPMFSLLKNKFVDFVAFRPQTSNLERLFELSNWLVVISIVVLIALFPQPHFNQYTIYLVAGFFAISFFLYYKYLSDKIKNALFYKIILDALAVFTVLLLAGEAAFYLFWIYLVIITAAVASLTKKQSIFIAFIIAILIIAQNIFYGFSLGSVISQWYIAAAELIALFVMSVHGIFLTSEFQSAESERALQESYIDRLTKEDKKREVILSSIADGLFIFDQHGYITEVNHALEELTQTTAADLIGSNVNQISWIPDTDGNPFIKTIKEGKIILNMELEIQPIKQTTTLPVLVSSSPFHDDDNNIAGGVALLRNISQLKEVEKSKNEFVGIVAHQLRGPLTATKWALDMILKQEAGPISSDQAEIIKNTYESNEHLIRLVSDLLDVSRIEEGRIKYEFKSDHLERIIEQVLREETESIQQKNLHVTFDKMVPDMPAVTFDERTMTQVVQNLIENAIKYTAPGGTISIQQKVFTENGKESMLVSVKDSGIGVPDYQKDKIFTKFFRADNAQGFAHEGTGLGLYLAKVAIEKHKGRIWFESKIGEGTTFFFAIPLQ